VKGAKEQTQLYQKQTLYPIKENFITINTFKKEIYKTKSYGGFWYLHLQYLNNARLIF
jgi:hypothetical protein